MSIVHEPGWLVDKNCPRACRAELCLVSLQVLQLSELLFYSLLCVVDGWFKQPHLARVRLIMTLASVGSRPNRTPPDLGQVRRLKPHTLHTYLFYCLVFPLPPLGRHPVPAGWGSHRAHPAAQRPGGCERDPGLTGRRQQGLEAEYQHHREPEGREGCRGAAQPVGLCRGEPQEHLLR